MAKAVAKVANTNDYKFVALNDAAADKIIKSIRTRGAKLRKDMHETAVGLVMHMIEHGRHTKFIPLADAIGDILGANQRQAFIEWTMAFTHLTYDKDQKVFNKDHDKENKLEDAKATPFWDFEKKPVDKPVDIQKLIKEALTRASKASEKGNVTDASDASFIEHIAAAVASYKKPVVTEVIKGEAPAEVEGKAEEVNA